MGGFEPVSLTSAADFVAVWGSVESRQEELPFEETQRAMGEKLE